jgi:hypothetical protein
MQVTLESPQRFCPDPSYLQQFFPGPDRTVFAAILHYSFGHLAIQARHDLQLVE